MESPYDFIKIVYYAYVYSDDSFIRTHLFPVDISGLMSVPDYWITH